MLNRDDIHGTEIDGFFAKQTYVADCDASSEKPDSHCRLSQPGMLFPNLEVDPSIDAPTSDSSSSVNLVIRDVLDGKSISDIQKLEVIRKRKPAAACSLTFSHFKDKRNSHERHNGSFKEVFLSG